MLYFKIDCTLHLKKVLLRHSITCKAPSTPHLESRFSVARTGSGAYYVDVAEYQLMQTDKGTLGC